MKRTKLKKLVICTLLFFALSAKAQIQSIIPSIENERWWGGMIAAGSKMPFNKNCSLYDLSDHNLNNQITPLLLSSHGRYIWSEEPFSFQLRNDTLYIVSKTQQLSAVSAGKTLKDAYLEASANFFPYTGDIPVEEFFSKPQYNTWIELMYDQNQNDIMYYADQIIKNDYPVGIFMVDDNWQRYYGNFDFKMEKFKNPLKMNKELHSLGFQIMLWVSPFITSDTPEYREYRDRGYLLKNKNGEPAIIHWWNGYSATVDLTNPEAVEYFKNELRKCQKKYEVDGFKFDAGDISYMKGDFDFFDKNADANIYSQRWAELALDFPYNELRTTWKTGGLPLVQRLGDKDYSWDAVSLLIPDMITAGIMGYAYTCPDMIGGGQFTPFMSIKAGEFDEELIVRSCQVHSLMPMMQFSVAPWRILSPENNAICAKFARLHKEFGEYFVECAKNTSTTNEPIIRSLEYSYPHQGYIDCKDQFMVGEKYLVAPMVTTGTSREVIIPKGRWKDDLGKIIRGPKVIKIDVPLDRLPYYERLK